MSWPPLEWQDIDPTDGFRPYEPAEYENVPRPAILKPHRAIELSYMVGAYLNKVTTLAPDQPEIYDIIEKHIKLLVSELQEENHEG